MRCSQEELLGLLASAPQRFSPNVALRCIVQQALFPAAAYVAGPGEIAYWAQLKPMFAFFGLPMPIVYPRASARLCPTKILQLQENLGVTPEQLSAPPEALLTAALGHTADNPALKTLREDTPGMTDTMDALVERLEMGGATTDTLQAARAWKKRSMEGLERVEKILARQDERHVAAVEKQLKRLRETLAPDGKPQERVYSVLSFLFAQGEELIPKLTRSLDIDSFWP